MKTYRDDPNYLFTLLVNTSKGKVNIRAFESAASVGYSPTHHRIDVEVRLGGKIMFPRGQLYCGIPQGNRIGGIAAKELVMSLVGMKPGDTDFSYFEDYSPGQLEFARSVGEDISMAAHDRYCDRNGNVKKER